MDQICVKTHQFGRGDVFGGISSLYTSFRYLLRISDHLSNEQLRKTVADFILQHEDMHYEALRYVPVGNTIEYCCKQIKNGNIQIIDLEVQALVMLYGKAIYLVYKSDKLKSIEVFPFLDHVNMSSDTMCIYIFYDETKSSFNPLYVTTECKTTKITTFNYNDNVVKSLLRKFIKDDLKYKNDVKTDDYDDNNINKATCPTEYNRESKSVSSSIPANDNNNSSYEQKATGDKKSISSDYNYSSCKNGNKKGTNDLKMFGHVIVKQGLCFKEQSNVRKCTKDYQLETGRRSTLDNKSSRIGNKISEVTHKFRREEADPDGSCLFWSVGYLVGSLKNSTVEDICKAMLNYISQDEELKSLAVASVEGCQNFEDYKSRITGGLWGGEFEISTLAKTHEKLIILASIEYIHGELDWKISYYDTESNPLSECIYVLFDEKLRHFDPLVVINKIDSKEKFKIFKRGDQTIRNLLIRFIRENFNYKKEIKFIDQIETSSVTKGKSTITKAPLFSMNQKSKTSSQLAFNYNQKCQQTEPVTSCEKRFYCGAEDENTSNYNHKLLETRRFFYAGHNNIDYYFNILKQDLLNTPAQYLMKIYLLKRNDNNICYHPYWKFQVQSIDKHTYYCNPMDIELDIKNKLITDPDGTQQLKLSVLVNRIIYDELATSTTTSNEFDIAISLWRKQADETKFYQYNDVKYIRNISTKGKSNKEYI
ncbi:unnamed protein product [Rotaria sp. Silwood1]|nr:unnamed protein product [Rotaria sp. Silwood1]CAF1651682.1 unnamed protein product [Rotaria sp. Silwood1]